MQFGGALSLEDRSNEESQVVSPPSPPTVPPPNDNHDKNSASSVQTELLYSDDRSTKPPHLMERHQKGAHLSFSALS